MEKETLRAARVNATACAETVSLPLRSRVWKGMAGDFAGAGTGSSLDFQDQRNYAPGDDPRHINWQAYARTGSYTMKLFREEVRPLVDLVFDVSESMFFETNKAKRSAEIFYTIISSAHQAGASLKIHLIKGNAHRQIPLEAVLTDQWYDIANSLTNLTTDKNKTPDQTPQLQHINFRANTIRVFISDLLFADDPQPLIKHATQHQGSLIIFAPYSESEATPNWTGNYEFVDAETSRSHPHRIEPRVLEQYQQAYTNHFQLWHTAAQRHQTPLARIPSEPDLMSALQQDCIKSGALEM